MCAALLATTVVVAGCGGSGLADSELSGVQADASEAAYNISSSCLSGSTSIRSDFSENVDKLLEAYSKSEKDADVKGTMRDAAGTLRNCGQDDQAERLDRATD